MSWKRQDAFQVNTSYNSQTSHNNKPDLPYKHTVDKEMSFKRLETEILQADMIESSLLIMNNKDMMITSDRINIHTPKNNISIPPAGAIKINKACKIDDTNVHITGNLLLDKEFNTSVMLRKVQRIVIDKENNFNFEGIFFTKANHFILDCLDSNATGMLVIPPYKDDASTWSKTNLEYLYIMQIYVNCSKDAIVDIDVLFKEQGLTLKLHSRNSSLSLLWLPEGKWIIHSLGYKTSITYDE